MRRSLLVLALLGVLAIPAVAGGTRFSLPGPSVRSHGGAAPVLVAFRGHFGFGGLRGRRYGYGYGYRSRHPFLRRVVRTAIWLYVLHLFFTHGGLSILLWILIIAFVIMLVRRRRRRYAY